MINKFLSNLKKESYLAAVITVALFTAVFAGAWDVWWHGFLGRESFWSPPHLLLYGAVIVTILSGLYGWKTQNNTTWKWLGIVLLLVPFSAPFDELWHRLYGVEETSSVLVLWSPPHVVLILAIAASLVLVFRVIRKNKDIVQQRFFGALSLAALYMVLSIILNPLFPLGPWAITGFWSAGILALLFIAIMSSARLTLKGIAPATLTAFFIIALTSITFGEPTAVTDVASAEFSPHAHLPGWLTIFSILLPALWIDLRKSFNALTAGIAGGISAGVFYGFGKYFIEPELIYGSGDIVTAIVASIIGGFIAGVIVKKIINKTSNNNG